MKLTGIKIDSRLFHLNSCLPFPKNTPAFYENTPAFLRCCCLIFLIGIIGVVNE